MTYETNPFTPTFGVVPAIMAGREHLLAEMRRAFEEGVGNPNLSTIIIGARGTGKTALLSCIANEAQQAGWISADVVCGTGMLDDILQRSTEAAVEYSDPKTKKKLTGLSVAQVIGLQWESDNPLPANWRTRMNALFKDLSTHDVGLLITVDEVKATVEEMIQLASMYQLFVREGKKVALVMAGLPKHVSSLVGNEDVSFLRRARQHRLDSISNAEVLSAFRKTVENAGKSIDRTALDCATEAVHGFPYMLQLVGYFSWAESNGSKEVTEDNVARGVELASQDLETGVLDATYRELSDGDRTFLIAMLDNGETCRLADVAKKMGKPNGYAATYKARLLDQGVIEELSDGTLQICIPFFKEYLEAIKACD